MNEPLYTVTLTESQRREVVRALQNRVRWHKHRTASRDPQKNEKSFAERQANAEALHIVSEAPENPLDPEQ